MLGLTIRFHFELDHAALGLIIPGSDAPLLGIEKPRAKGTGFQE